MSALPRRLLLAAGPETRFHHFDEVTPPLRALLESHGYSVETSLGGEAFYPQRLRTVDAIVSITTRGELGPDQECALLDAVGHANNDRGRSIPFIALHGASCSFLASAAYYQMLGGRFISHLAMREFRVHIEDPQHPITQGLDDFTIFEEQYRIAAEPDIHVLMSAERPRASDDSDIRDPVVGNQNLTTAAIDDAGAAPQRDVLAWFRQFGSGRVAYCALGHSPAQLQHPAVQRFVLNALDWGRLSLP